MSVSELLDWDGAAAAGAETAGGKGWNLGRLHRYGFAVPPGGVISASAYRRFMARPGLRPLIDALAPVTAADAAAAETVLLLDRLRAAISAAPMPHGLMADLDGFLAACGLSSRPVAVRSSATAEDSAAASFAGIHQSFLHVTGVMAVADAVKGCYASLWTPHALAYRRRMALPDDAVAAAVVILAMVPARTAGVGFSCDPRTGRLDRFTIAASLGLGEAVVSGQAEPDAYIVDITKDPPVVAASKVGRKECMTVARAGGGTELAPVAPQDAVQPALTDVQIRELSYLIGRVQDALGGMQCPQDMEWAHDGQQFWVLQARPVTSFTPATFDAVANQPQVWSSANLKDVMPGVQSTLGWSFLRSGIDVLLTAPFLAGGYDCPQGIGWIRLFAGRPYFNLTALQWAFWDAFAMPPGEVNRIMGGHQPEIAVPALSAVQRAQRSLRQLRMIRRVMAALRGAPAEFRRLWDWAERAEAEPMAGWSKAQYLRQMLTV
ncbi:MAG: pyruvate phosphate dikinase PEP/pyruvate-binding, partial [Firmicutes bacterium]|nr:pyruvate phosphate dikinase PEP/pyruvate-binding [Bacillota bacterium]